MSKISASDPSMTRSRVTQCPGTLVYMPPEALRPQPRYSDKIDTFSIGVLLLQIVTRKFSSPSAASTTREDSISAWGEIDVPVREVERRKSDMDKVTASHGFLPVIRDCLKDKSKDRPTAAQLCHSLGQLKNSAVYSGSRSAELLEVGFQYSSSKPVSFSLLLSPSLHSYTFGFHCVPYPPSHILSTLHLVFVCGLPYYLTLSPSLHPREEQSSMMLLGEEMWRQFRDSSPLLSISTPGLRL